MKHLSLFLIITATCVLSLQTALAAPHPATSTSALTSPDKGYYFQFRGFNLKTTGTTWVGLNSSESVLDTIKLGPPNSQSEGSLSVRTDKLAKNADLELYTRKWMRDYPSYGFEVLATKNLSLNNQPALLVDMLSRAKNKQIRQVILKRGDTVAVMTCMDQRESFDKTLAQCNQIMKTFSWNADTAPSAPRSK